MSDFGLKDSGFNPKRQDKILEEINEGTESVFGESVNLSPSSPDGQINGLNSIALADQWDLANNVYLSFDVKSAQGVSFSRLVTLNGITRNAATKSAATCTFTGTQGTSIPLGFQVSVAGTDDIFKTTIISVIPVAGFVDVPMQAIETGSVQADAGTLTNIVNPLNGIASATNAATAVTGKDEESDPELRNRQILSTTIASQSLIGSQYSNLLNIDDVKSVFIYENDTAITNVLGLPPHSFNVIILGGDDVVIVNTISILKIPGILAFGTTTLNITDAGGLLKPISFTRPIPVPIYVTVNTTITGDFPVDGIESMKQAIIDYAATNIFIGQDIERTRLFTPINSIPGHSVQTLFIGLTPSPIGLADIPIAFNELGEFLTANITVNII